MSDELMREVARGYPVSREQGEAFCAALGDALSAWQLVESALYRLYEAAILPAVPGALAASFHEIQTFNMKLRVTDMAVRFTLLGNEHMTKGWKRLSARLRAKNDRRNDFSLFRSYHSRAKEL